MTNRISTKDVLKRLEGLARWDDLWNLRQLLIEDIRELVRLRKTDESPHDCEPVPRCDTTTARVKKLIEMDAVPSYVVAALLHERDAWRSNYWMRMEQIAKQSSPVEPSAPTDSGT